MGFLSSYSENVQIVHHSTTFSRATFFNLVILILAVTCPYLIAYRTQGFWTKIDRVREHPVVQFKHEALLVLDIGKDGSKESKLWSTFKSLNKMVESKVTPFIISRQGDHNMDGIYEYLDMQITIPIEKNASVFGFHLFLLFEYKLLKHATANLESLAYVNYNSGRPWNRFNIIGDLELNYKTPLWSWVHDERYNTPVIPREGKSIRDYDIGKILKEYSFRNLTTALGNKYEFIEDDNEVGPNEFMLSIRINYAEATYDCWAGVWNILKWAWVQYVAIFIIVFGILKKFQKTVYEAKIFETLIEVPWEKKKSFKTVISHQNT